MTTVKSKELDKCNLAKSQIDNITAQSKLISMVVSACQKGNNLNQRETRVQNAYNALKSNFAMTRLTFDQRASVRNMYRTIKPTDKIQADSPIKNILTAQTPQTLHSNLVDAGFDSQLITDIMVRKHMTTYDKAAYFQHRHQQPIKNPATSQFKRSDTLNTLSSEESDVADNSLADNTTIRPTSIKGQFIINTEKLIELANNSRWVKNILAAHAAPVLLEKSKTDSKARLQSAFEELQKLLSGFERAEKITVS